MVPLLSRLALHTAPACIQQQTLDYIVNPYLCVCVHACSYLRIFRCHQQLWMKHSPAAICGFAVDRPAAEQLLNGQPVV